MSETKQQQKIARLLQVARNSMDPESLRQIEYQAEQLSAWPEAQEVERRANEAEKWYAELAASGRAK